MYAEAIDVLTSIERGCDTNTLRYRDICYWPLVRQHLWRKLMLQLFADNEKSGGVAISNEAPSWPDVGAVNVVAAGPPELGLLQTDSKTAAALAAIKPRALFYLRPEEYMDTVAGKRFAKTVDSVREHAGRKYPVLKLELAEPRTISFDRFFPSLFLQMERAQQGVRFDPPGVLENFPALAAALERTGAGITLDPAELLERIGRIFYFARIFEKVLGVLGPKVFFLSVYYHLVGMGAMLACRRLGITSVDLQHGRLGPHEGHYTQLTAAPESGYHLLPDMVWCWGGKTKHDIDVDKNPRCARHGGIVGGNTWLQKWRYGDTGDLEPPEAAAFAGLTGGRKRILVSLQPLARPVPPELMEAMRRAPPDWLWLLRMHPLRKHTAPELAANLAAAGIANIEIDNATALPLFSLLRICDHHVTAFSSVAMEAAAFGLRTSFLAPEGLKIFTSYMERGICRYTPTAQEILQDISTILAKPCTPIEDDFIDMRAGLVDNTLDHILA